jgi:NAD(P)-dependent dehydrogenase (short-subunit alcohol dehydrogenase family)
VTAIPAQPEAEGIRRRRAVLSGSSSGIGLAIARRLLEDSWSVTGLDRTPSAFQHPLFSPVAVDLIDGDALDRALSNIAAVDAIVHAAGFMRTAPLGGLDLRDGEAMWQVHVAAAVRLVDRLASLLPSGGRIVLIGSRTSNGAGGRSQYAASKAALTGLSRSWAIELAGRGVTVNVVSPGATDTPMLVDPMRGSEAPRLPPLGRFVRPEEIAGTVAFLLGDDAGAITGQNLVVCGGASL